MHAGARSRKGFDANVKNAASLGSAVTGLPRPWFARDAESVARDLVGCRLDVGHRRLRIVETEAYVGEHDLACHARVGRTPRTSTMFGPAGHAYVYLIYGMHHMLNVVTGPEGSGEAVLIRAAEPLDGLAGRTDGPARLTKALGITVQQHNGLDLLQTPELSIENGPRPHELGVSPRIGVDYAGEWAAAPLRFYDPDSAWITGRAGRLPTGSQAGR